jgi:hypothetical protein
MKPLERIFFMQCHDYWASPYLDGCNTNEIISEMAHWGFNEKRLRRYVKKWLNNGICTHNAETGMLEFIPDKLYGEYQVIHWKKMTYGMTDFKGE